MFPTLTVPATGTGLDVVFTTVTGAELTAVDELVVAEVVCTCAEPVNAKTAVKKTLIDTVRAILRAVDATFDGVQCSS